MIHFLKKGKKVFTKLQKYLNNYRKFSNLDLKLILNCSIPSFLDPSQVSQAFIPVNTIVENLFNRTSSVLVN